MSMATMRVTAGALRTGDNIWLGPDAGVRVHRVEIHAGVVAAYRQADPADPRDEERVIGTYLESGVVRLHGRDVAALTS